MGKLSLSGSSRTRAAVENGEVLFLLPPSETKSRPDPEEARALDLERLTLPELSHARETMVRAVQRTAASRDAADLLGVPASAPELVDRMAAIQDEPAGRPFSVYSGVLFDQLAPATVVPADRQVLVQSALFGLVDASGDRIPAYRVSATSKLSRLGTAGTWWRRHLTPVGKRLTAAAADSSSPLVIDCRSGAYRSMMPMRSGDGARVLEVSPVQELRGRRKVVSHDAKRYRGWVTRVLLDAPAAAASADEAVDQLRAGFDGTLGVELDEDRLLIIDRVG